MLRIVSAAILVLLILSLISCGKTVESYDPGKPYEMLFQRRNIWYVINTATYSCVDTIGVSFGGWVQYGPAFTSSGDRAYSAVEYGLFLDSIKVVESNWPPTEILSTITFDSNYNNRILLSPEGDCLYANATLIDLCGVKPSFTFVHSRYQFVGHEFFVPGKQRFCYYNYNDTLVCIDYSDQTWQQTSYCLSEKIGHSFEPVSICVSPDGETCFMSGYRDYTYVMSTSDFRAIGTLPIVGCPSDLNWNTISNMRISPDGERLFFNGLSSQFGLSLFFYDFDKKEVTRLVSEKSYGEYVYPFTYVLAPDGNDIFFNADMGPSVHDDVGVIRYNIPSGQFSRLLEPKLSLSTEGMIFRPLH